MADTIIGKGKEAIVFSIFCHKASNASNKEELSFCLRYVHDDGDICEDFVKFIYCKSGLIGKDLCNEATEASSSFGPDLRNCRCQRYDIAGHVNFSCSNRIFTKFHYKI